MNILTIDLEEWYHFLDNSLTEDPSQWIRYEERIYFNTHTILDLLEEHNLKATFFVVGWIAERYPDIIKLIDSKGFEIGSHTHLHHLLYNKSSKVVIDDLKKSIDILESLTGKKVYAFRAPGFSIKEENSWVFEVLISNGITHDSSIFPVRRAHGGFPSFEINEPCLIEYNNNYIKEFPINTFYSYVFSGGGYFRLTPYVLIKYFTRKSKYVMSYFHPRDFDFEQPRLKMSLLRGFKSYIGLKRTYAKASNWFYDFEFMDLREADKKIQWDSVQIVNLK